MVYKIKKYKIVKVENRRWHDGFPFYSIKQKKTLFWDYIWEEFGYGPVYWKEPIYFKNKQDVEKHLGNINESEISKFDNYKKQVEIMNE